MFLPHLILFALMYNLLLSDKFWYLIENTQLIRLNSIYSCTYIQIIKTTVFTHVLPPPL
jgi:hypothetical protein